MDFFNCLKCIVVEVGRNLIASVDIVIPDRLWWGGEGSLLILVAPPGEVLPR